MKTGKFLQRQQGLEENPKIREVYDHIQEVNKEVGSKKEADESRKD